MDPVTITIEKLTCKPRECVWNNNDQCREVRTWQRRLFGGPSSSISQAYCCTREATVTVSLCLYFIYSETPAF